MRDTPPDEVQTPHRLPTGCLGLFLVLLVALTLSSLLLGLGARYWWEVLRRVWRTL